MLRGKAIFLGVMSLLMMLAIVSCKKEVKESKYDNHIVGSWDASDHAIYPFVPPQNDGVADLIFSDDTGIENGTPFDYTITDNEVTFTYSSGVYTEEISMPHKDTLVMDDIIYARM